MAVLSNQNLTLADWTKRQDPDGKVAVIAELLSQENQILDDMVVKEANQATSHRVSIRTGLPTAYWRSYNKGVPSSKSTTAQIDEGIGMLEAYATIDKAEADLNGNVAAFRASEDLAFLEAMNQAQALTMIYGNPANDPRQFMGLSTRYGTISGAGNAANILDAGGVGSINTSIWLVCWDENSVFATFPKGSKSAGLVHTDLGEQTVYDDVGNPYQAYRSHYTWMNGLVVKDWRQVVRICNIDTSITNNNITADVIAAMARATVRIKNIKKGKPCFYLNRTIFSMLMIQALNKSNAALAVQNAVSQFGQSGEWLTFLGIPLRCVDQILNTEARVV